MVTPCRTVSGPHNTKSTTRISDKSRDRPQDSLAGGLTIVQRSYALTGFRCKHATGAASLSCEVLPRS